MLKEAVNAQRQVEGENRSLREDKERLTQRFDDVIALLHTQEQIANLKLKERDVLLRELTEQVNELRTQVKRDRKLFAEMDNSAKSNPPLPSLKGGSRGGSLHGNSTISEVSKKTVG